MSGGFDDPSFDSVQYINARFPNGMVTVLCVCFHACLLACLLACNGLIDCLVFQRSLWNLLIVA